jgi:hypothetical protein
MMIHKKALYERYRVFLQIDEKKLDSEFIFEYLWYPEMLQRTNKVARSHTACIIKKIYLKKLFVAY